MADDGTPIPRIAPGGFAELGPVNWLICRVVSLAVRAPDAHLFSTLGRHRRLFRAWLRFASQLMGRGSLSRRDAEMAILRVAHLRNSQYELDHHRRLGKRAGLGPVDIERTFAGPEAPGWSEPHRALLRAVDSLVRNRDLDDATWRAVRRHYDERELIELCFLVGHYDLLAMTIGALRIQRDFP